MPVFIPPPDIEVGDTVKVLQNVLGARRPKSVGDHIKTGEVVTVSKVVKGNFGQLGRFWYILYDCPGMNSGSEEGTAYPGTCVLPARDVEVVFICQCPNISQIGCRCGVFQREMARKNRTP